MANNAINVKCNFTTIFSKFNTENELRSLANIICGQVKEAFEARMAEITATTGDDLTVEVEVETTTAAAPAVAPQPKSKGKGKTAAAKEVAERMKKSKETDKATAKAKAETKAETKAATTSDDDALIAITDLAAIKKLGLTFEKYNDRCWVLRGNTKPLRKILKDQFRGVFNSRLTGGEGWVFKTANAQNVSDALGLKVKVA